MNYQPNEAFGVDIGGSGIKGAPVDLSTGQLLTERYRIETPQPATPKAVSNVVAEVVAANDWTGPVGCAFPAVVQQGVIRTAANVDDSWIGVNGEEKLSKKLGVPVQIINDADAAGIAEMHFGAGRDHRNKGVVLMLTFGTGIGSAVFVEGHLLPNCEFGHLEIKGEIAEKRAAAQLRENKVLSWDKWISRVQRFLTHIESLINPDLIIFGGGISKRSDRFLDELKTECPMVPAELLNNAGIVGAAYAAACLETISEASE